MQGTQDGRLTGQKIRILGQGFFRSAGRREEFGKALASLQCRRVQVTKHSGSVAQDLAICAFSGLVFTLLRQHPGDVVAGRQGDRVIGTQAVDLRAQCDVELMCCVIKLTTTT